jgi:hypothetical protein
LTKMPRTTRLQGLSLSNGDIRFQAIPGAPRQPFSARKQLRKV